MKANNFLVIVKFKKIKILKEQSNIINIILPNVKFKLTKLFPKTKIKLLETITVLSFNYTVPSDEILDSIRCNKHIEYAHFPAKRRLMEVKKL